MGVFDAPWLAPRRNRKISRGRPSIRRLEPVGAIQSGGLECKRVFGKPTPQLRGFEAGGSI
jgi:hypothetical protein